MKIQPFSVYEIGIYGKNSYVIMVTGWIFLKPLYETV
jgi:hypothetical protein